MKMSDDGEMISGRFVLEDHWQYECVDGGEGGLLLADRLSLDLMVKIHEEVTLEEIEKE